MYKKTTTEKISMELITPEKAKRIMVKNIANRNINKKRVTQYATSMERGEWVENGQTIVLSKEGFLLDGQHRLSAVIKSGVPVRFIVAYLSGVESSPIGVPIDLGQSRNVSQITGIKRNYVSSIATMMRMYEVQGSRKARDPIQVEKRYNILKDCFEEIPKTTRKMYSTAELFGMFALRLYAGLDYTEIYRNVLNRQYEKIDSYTSSWMRFIEDSYSYPLLDMKQRFLAGTFEFTNPKNEQTKRLRVNKTESFEDSKNFYMNIMNDVL